MITACGRVRRCDLGLSRALLSMRPVRYCHSIIHDTLVDREGALGECQRRLWILLLYYRIAIVITDRALPGAPTGGRNGRLTLK